MVKYEKIYLRKKATLKLHKMINNANIIVNKNLMNKIKIKNRRLHTHFH